MKTNILLICTILSPPFVTSSTPLNTARHGIYEEEFDIRYRDILQRFQEQLHPNVVDDSSPPETPSRDDKIWPFKREGVSFSRDVKQVPPNSYVKLNFDEGSHCKLSDNFGDNDCEFKWGETIQGNFTEISDVTLDAGDKLVFHIEAEKVFHIDFSCDVCGEDCVITIPVINDKIVFAMPPCPIESPFTYLFTQVMPDSATFELAFLMSGHVYLLKNGDENQKISNADFTFKIN